MIIKSINKYGLCHFILKKYITKIYFFLHKSKKKNSKLGNYRFDNFYLIILFLFSYFLLFQFDCFGNTFLNTNPKNIIYSVLSICSK